MRERIAALGGVLRFAAREDRGFTLEAALPARKALA
jgi:signal transduction histidine kinase